MKIVRVCTDSSHETYAESVEPVQWADGTVAVMNFTFMHDDTLNTNCKEGAIIKQGEHFFDEGGFGRGKAGTFGNHLHLEVGKRTSPRLQQKNAQGTAITPGQVHIYDALFLRPDIVIRNAGGYPWKTEKAVGRPVERNPAHPQIEVTIDTLNVVRIIIRGIGKPRITTNK